MNGQGLTAHPVPCRTPYDTQNNALQCDNAVIHTAVALADKENTDTTHPSSFSIIPRAASSSLVMGLGLDGVSWGPGLVWGHITGDCRGMDSTGHF